MDLKDIFLHAKNRKVSWKFLVISNPSHFTVDGGGAGGA